MRKFAPLILLSSLAGFSLPAQAASTLHEVQLLSFGEISVATHGVVQSVVIGTDGSTGNDAGIIKLLPGRNAIYALNGFPASIPLAIGIVDTVLTGPNGSTFDIHDFTFDPVAMTQETDSSGNMMLRIGATLSTRSGIAYDDGPYRGTYTVMVNY